jgi:hypothetical protein
MNSGLHTGELRIGDFPKRADLEIELESFEASFSGAGRMKIDGGTRTGHADMAMAVAQAYWLSDSRGMGTVVGEQRLRGYW